MQIFQQNNQNILIMSIHINAVNRKKCSVFGFRTATAVTPMHAYTADFINERIEQLDRENEQANHDNNDVTEVVVYNVTPVIEQRSGTIPPTMHVIIEYGWCRKKKNKRELKESRIIEQENG